MCIFKVLDVKRSIPVKSSFKCAISLQVIKTLVKVESDDCFQITVFKVLNCCITGNKSLLIAILNPGSVTRTKRSIYYRKSLDSDSINQK